jgi:hypothetical protein
MQMKKLTSLLVVVALAAPTVGCGSHAGTIVKNDLIDCGKQDLGQTVKEAGVSLLMTVMGILVQGGTNWRQDLSALGGEYGSDAVSCAAKIAADLFKNATGTDTGSGSGSDSLATSAEIGDPYARAVLFNQGKSFK